MMAISRTVCVLVALLPCILAEGLLDLGSNTNIPGISAFPDLGSGLPKLPSVTDPLKLPVYPQPRPTYPSQSLYPKASPQLPQYPSVPYGQPTPYQPGPNRLQSRDYKNYRLLRALGIIPAPGKTGGYASPQRGYVPPNTGYVLPKAGYVPPKTGQVLPKPGYVPPKSDYVPAKSVQPTLPGYDIYSRIDQLYKDRTPGLPYQPSPKHGHGVGDLQKCHPNNNPRCYGYLKVCECQKCGHYGCFHFCC